MRHNRRNTVHPHEVREQAVKLMSELNFTPKQVSQKLGVPLKTVQSWRAKYHATLSPEQLSDIRYFKRRKKHAMRLSNILKVIIIASGGIKR